MDIPWVGMETAVCKVTGLAQEIPRQLALFTQIYGYTLGGHGNGCLQGNRSCTINYRDNQIDKTNTSIFAGS